jgi:hypothetical protein
MAPYLEQIKPAFERNSEILAPLRRTVQLEERRNQELRDAEAQLMRLNEAEEDTAECQLARGVASRGVLAAARGTVK